MTLKHMKIFVAVCNENSITLAAKKLYLSQPAVSLAVKELEEYYGVKLFERLSRKIYITEAGKRVYSYAVHIVSLFEEMDEKIKNWDNDGKIRIGSSITIGTQLMPGLVQAFLRLYPHAETYVTIDSSDIIEKKIITNEVDIALIEGVVHTDNIISEPFFDDELAIICDADNPLCKKDYITIEDLADQRLLLREKNSGTREIVENFLAMHDFVVNPAWESTSTQAIVNAVADGLGISILPLQLITSYRNSQKLCRLNLRDVEFKRQFHILYHKNKYLTKIETDFIALCKRECK